MAQLQWFTRTELAGMRDRTRGRNYSASRDEFRRAHEKSRAWGLRRRHAERLRHLRERQAGSWPADLRVPGAAVDGSPSGISVQSPPSAPSRVVWQPTPACDPQAGPVKLAGAAGLAGAVELAGPVGAAELVGAVERAGPVELVGVVGRAGLVELAGASGPGRARGRGRSGWSDWSGGRGQSSGPGRARGRGRSGWSDWSSGPGRSRQPDGRASPLRAGGHQAGPALPGRTASRLPHSARPVPQAGINL